MDLAQVWKPFLTKWPTGLERKGVVVTSEEQIVFVEFLMAETVVMFERQAPDSMGGRKVILPYSEIKSVKITEPVNNQPFFDTGFAPSLQAARPSAPSTARPVAKAPPSPPAAAAAPQKA